MRARIAPKDVGPCIDSAREEITSAAMHGSTARSGRRPKHATWNWVTGCEEKGGFNNEQALDRGSAERLGLGGSLSHALWRAAGGR
jgi:hypothetical protein